MRKVASIFSLILMVAFAGNISAGDEINSQNGMASESSSSVPSAFEAGIKAKELQESLRLEEISKTPPDQDAELSAASQRLGIKNSPMDGGLGSDDLAGFAKIYSAGDAYFQALQDPNSPESKAIERRRAINFAFNSFVIMVILVSVFFALKYSSKKGLWKKRKYRIFAAVFAGWTSFVALRTSDSYELLGMYIRQWDDDTFFVSWLFPPAVLLVAFYILKWVKAGER